MNKTRDIKTFFPNDTYKTPAKVKRYLGDRLFLNSRWYFYYKYISTVLRYRSAAIEGKYTDEVWADSSKKMHETVEKCGGQIEIEGLDHLRNISEPVVFVGNHMSTAESQLLPAIIEPIKKVTFVVKESLVKAKVWGPIMRAREPIVVSRVDPRKDMAEVLNKGVELLKKGRSIFIFPQSTRNVNFNPEEFNSLGVKLAKKAKVKILPLALKTDFWGNGRYATAFGPIKRKNVLHFKFGAAKEITGNGKEQHQEIVEFIQSNLNRWKIATKKS